MAFVDERCSTSPGSPARQGSKPTACESLSGETVIAEAWVYKSTRVLGLSDLVVRRRLRLFRDRITTFHDFNKDPADQKSWILDRSCKLEPENADELAPARKFVRPPGTWTVTASVMGAAMPVDLVSPSSLLWPSWNGCLLEGW